MIKEVLMNDVYNIELLHLSKKYSSENSEFIGIRDVNLKLEAGEIHCFLGPNGAGKTTLLKMIGTMHAPTAGSIYFNNKRLDELSARQRVDLKRQIGFLFESPFAYSMLTGHEFVSFIGEIYNVKKNTLAERIEYYFDIFEIQDWKNRYLSSYSQGMLKKIALVITLINDQSILIYDEPTNSLDPKMIATLKDVLVAERNKSKTIIISTHILDIAEKLADRITIIHDGKIKLTDSISILDNKKADKSRTKLEKVYFDITAKQE